MRKHVFGRQFKRDKNQRKALFKGLLSSLVLHERIKTTAEKAKSVKGDADKLITKAKKGGLHAYKLLEPELTNDAVRKVIDEIAPRFAQRQGGYTRITRLGRRTKDNAAMVLLEWTELGAKFQPTAKAAEGKTVHSDEHPDSVESTAKIAAPKKKETKKEVKPKTEKKPTKKVAKKEEKTK